MISRSQLDELHAQLGSQDSLPAYLRALARVGVLSFESYVCDGHSEFLGADNERITTEAQHPRLVVADVPDVEGALAALERHSEGLTSYEQMSSELASCGVQKWVADAQALTMTYCDRRGGAMHVERL